MKIEDIKIGTKVKLISTENTDEHLGYNQYEMLCVGSVSEVVDFGEEGDECHNVGLSDGYWYAVDDLELYEFPEKSIGNLTLNISVEDREEIAKDILKIVLQDLNDCVVGAINGIDDGEPKKAHSETEDDVLTNILARINIALSVGSIEEVSVLSKVYQRIKSVQTI